MNASLPARTKIVKIIGPEFRAGKQAKEELRSRVVDQGTGMPRLALKTARNANGNTDPPREIMAAREQFVVGLKFHQDQTSR